MYPIKLYLLGRSLSIVKVETIKLKSHEQIYNWIYVEEIEGREGPLNIFGSGNFNDALFIFLLNQPFFLKYGHDCFARRVARGCAKLVLPQGFPAPIGQWCRKQLIHEGPPFVRHAAAPNVFFY